MKLRKLFTIAALVLTFGTVAAAPAAAYLPPAGTHHCSWYTGSNGQRYLICW